MDKHIELLNRMREADPVIDPADPPSGAVSADIVLLEIERRSTIVQTTQDRRQTDSAPASGRWSGAKVAALAFVVVLVAGVAAALIGLSGSSTPPAGASFGLVGGENAGNFDDNFGYAFATDPVGAISSPGPTLEVAVGTEVTVTFTNRSGWSGASPQDEIPQSFRVVPTVPSAETLFGADTGLVDVDASATITFVADQVGEFRYVSDGLGMAARGMFGRFVVTDGAESDIENTTVAGNWTSGATTLDLAADNTFTFTTALGTATGTYEYNEAGDEPLLILETLNSTIPNAEFGEPCVGRDFLTATITDQTELQLAYVEGICDLTWPGFATLNRNQ